MHKILFLLKYIHLIVTKEFKPQKLYVIALNIVQHANWIQIQGFSIKLSIKVSIKAILSVTQNLNFCSNVLTKLIKYIFCRKTTRYHFEIFFQLNNHRTTHYPTAQQIARKQRKKGTAPRKKNEHLCLGYPDALPLPHYSQ